MYFHFRYTQAVNYLIFPLYNLTGFDYVLIARRLDGLSSGPYFMSYVGFTTGPPEPVLCCSLASVVVYSTPICNLSYVTVTH